MADVRRGPPGHDGLDGASAYEIARAYGFVGTEPEWLASLTGRPGVDGRKGDTGDRGEPGPQGRQGEPGRAGDTGGRGERGERGEKGADGRNGRDAKLPPATPYRATFVRDEVTLQTLRVYLASLNGTGTSWNLLPVYNESGRFFDYVDIVPAA